MHPAQMHEASRFRARAIDRHWGYTNPLRERVRAALGIPVGLRNIEVGICVAKWEKVG